MKTKLEPGRWHTVGADEIRAWRKNLSKGAVREVRTGFHNYPTIDTAEDDTGTFSTERRKPLEGRETAERVAADLIAWARSSPDVFMHRVRFLKAKGAMAHLTDEEAAEQLHTLALKIAQDSAERVFKTKGRAGITIRGGVLLGE